MCVIVTVPPKAHAVRKSYILLLLCRAPRSFESDTWRIYTCCWFAPITARKYPAFQRSILHSSLELCDTPPTLLPYGLSFQPKWLHLPLGAAAPTGSMHYRKEQCYSKLACLQPPTCPFHVCLPAISSRGNWI